MAILNQCCIRFSLREGSYASAIYALIYFFTFALLSGNLAYKGGEELMEFGPGNASMHPNVNANLQDSDRGEANYTDNLGILPHQSLATTAMIIIDFLCEIGGVIASILLIVGLVKESKSLMLPWIFVVPLHTAIDSCIAIHILISFFANPRERDNAIAMVFTVFTVILDFALNVINIYLTCVVISQYQEYCEGRGTAAYEQTQLDSFHYSGHPSNSQGRHWGDDLMNDRVENTSHFDDVDIHHGQNKGGRINEVSGGEIKKGPSVNFASGGGGSNASGGSSSSGGKVEINLGNKKSLKPNYEDTGRRKNSSSHGRTNRSGSTLLSVEESTAEFLEEFTSS